MTLAQADTSTPIDALIPLVNAALTKLGFPATLLPVADSVISQLGFAGWQLLQHSLGIDPAKAAAALAE